MAAFSVSGLSYRTAPVDLRERLAIGPDRIPAVADALRQRSGLQELVILSTCNRIELYGAPDPDGGRVAVALEAFCQEAGLDPVLAVPHTYTKSGAEAVRHCFRVAASLDSMVLGESQILGQVKDALAVAASGGSVGPLLHDLMAQAFSVAKRVRTETEIGKHAVSVSYVAVELARKIFGELRGRSALLLGAGGMGALAARHLVESGISHLSVTSRTWARAEELARALAGTPVAFDRWRETLTSVDIAIVATGAPETLVTRDVVRWVLAARGGRPLFLIDISVPRNVDPAVDELDGVFCYDVDDLQDVADANRRERQRAAARAEGLVEDEVGQFLSRQRDRDVVPTIVSLRAKGEAIRRDELERALARLRDASPEARAALEGLSSALVNKILHLPTVKLRESARRGGSAELAALVAEIFALDRARATRESEAAPEPVPGPAGVPPAPGVALAASQ